MKRILGIATKSWFHLIYAEYYLIGSYRAQMCMHSMVVDRENLGGFVYRDVVFG